MIQGLSGTNLKQTHISRDEFGINPQKLQNSPKKKKEKPLVHIQLEKMKIKEVATESEVQSAPPLRRPREAVLSAKVAVISPSLHLVIPPHLNLLGPSLQVHSAFA